MTAPTANENLFRLSGVGVVQTDLRTGRYLRVNQAFCEMVGYSETELQNMTNAELTHPEDWQQYSQRFAALQTGELLEDTALTRVLHKDGHEVWLELSITVMGEGEQATNLTIVSDASERVASEKLIRENELRKTFLLQLTDALGPLINSEDIQRIATQVTMAFFGTDRCYYCEIYNGNAIIRQDASQSGLPSVANTYPLGNMPIFQAVVNAGQSFIVHDAHTSDILDENLRQLCLDLQVVSFIDVPVIKGGQVVGLLCVTQATPRVWSKLEVELAEAAAERIWAAVERARAEAALTKSEEKYRTLFETMDEGYCVLELVFNEHGEITDLVYHEANAAFERHTGLAEANGKRASEVFPHIEREWFDALTRVQQTGVPERIESYNVDTGRWLSAQYSRVGGASSPFVAALFSDITERKQAEEALREDQARQTFLLKLSDALRAEPDADAVANRALQMLFEQLQLDRCYVGVYRLADDRGDITHQVGNDRIPPVPDGVRLSDFPEALRAAFNRTLVIDDVATMEGLSKGDRINLTALGMGALIVATLRKGEHNPYWSIVALSARPRVWAPSEIALVEEVTERTWAAMERARVEATLVELNATLERRVSERTEELEHSNTRFTQAFTLAPFPAFISTLAKPETILEVNDAFLEFARYKREEVIGKSAIDLKMWSSREDQRKIAQARENGTNIKNMALQLVDKEGNLLDVLLSAAVISIDRQENYLKMFYDVTEQKRSDEQMTLAVNSLFAEASWFSQGFVARLNHIRAGARIEDYKPLDLSHREQEVLIMVAKGWPNNRISEELGLKQQTIRNYLSNIFEKIGVHSRTEAAVWARERGLIA